MNLYDVVAVNLKTNQVRVMAKGKNLANADAYVSMAVMRRGLEEEFFVAVTAGKYSDGDDYRGWVT